MKLTLFSMKILRVLLLMCILLTCCQGDVTESEAYLSQFMADLWLEGADILKIIWKDCSKKLAGVKDVIDYKDHSSKLLRCIKRETLKTLDKSLDTDVIPIADGVNLVRFKSINDTGNTTSSNSTSTWTEKEIEEGEWRSLALQRISKILQTHVIKLDFDDTKIEKVEFRGRRRHHMMTMMMFGIVSIGMVLVPMGFQFLAVLGGKALLLAKMALILASIQGLKKVDTRFDGYHDRAKIASSPLNYGFYHPYPFEHYEKRSINDLTYSTVLPSSLSSIINHISPSKSISSKSKSAKYGDGKELTKASKRDKRMIWKINNDENFKEKSEAKLYPVYPRTLPTVYPSADESIPILDFTSTPSEVQADYTLDMPYNRLRFQSSTPILPS